MWTFNTDRNKWVITDDQLTKSNYDYLKQELVSTRLYSKCLSGATYLPINNLDNIYDILGEYEPRNWYIGTDGSQYTNSAIPTNDSQITPLSSYEYYTKYLSEYGLTLKNMFTPDRLIKDSINYIYVDVATTEEIPNINTRFTNLVIDGVRIIDGHRILVKNQTETETISFDINPNEYFNSNYTVVQDYGATIEYIYFSSDNGIYTYNNGYLTKTDDLTTYEDCIRYSVSVKLGELNTQKQFHLSRLLNGYYPTTSLNEPIEFVEKHNWLLRNKVDYNNLFEINYHDVLKHSTQIYNIDGITYSIPERTISVGEFGVILNTQGGISNIIPNKYKVDLRSIEETEKYYWICGDNGTLLKIRKHDFNIEKIDTNITKGLKSVSFFNNVKGVVVGDLNTILITDDGGINWFSIIVDDFESYYYNKVIFYSQSVIYIGGNTGVFIELEEDISGWSAYKRRVSKFIDQEEEYLLVDNINDMFYTSLSNWNLTFTYPIDNTLTTEDNKELLFIVTNDSKLIIYDINNSIPKFDFIYIGYNNIYGDFNRIIRNGASSKFLISSDSGILSFDIDDLQNIGIDNEFSNTIDVTQGLYNHTDIQVNNLYDYNGDELIICGNTSLLKSATYSNPFNFNKLDSNFEDRLKSKMLFLDYDVASKLNFFTDDGTYRLPNSTNINLISLTDDITYSSMETPIEVNGNIDGSFKTGIKVTDLNTNPKDIRVKINLTNNNGIGNTLINLRAPNGNVINLKKVGSGTGTSLSNVTFTTSTDYPKFRDSVSPYTNNVYQMDKTEPIVYLNRSRSLEILSTIEIGFNSNITELSQILNSNGGFDGNWTLYVSWSNPNTGSFTEKPINQPIGTLSSWDITFVYEREEEIDIDCINFTPIVYGATAPSFMTQSETNWLTYWKDSQKTFEYYSTLPLDESKKVEISTEFRKSNRQTSFTTTSITNDKNIVSRLAPSILDLTKSRFEGVTPNPILYPLQDFDIYIYEYIMILKVNKKYPVNTGDVIRLESSVVDSEFVVNRIETLTNNSNVTSKYLYMFNNFNENIIEELKSTQISITNLNKFSTLSELDSRFGLHPISNGYKLSYSINDGEVKIDAKFNNITSYYNLATNVNISGKDGVGNSLQLTKEMVYTDGFLKFGYTPTYNILDYLEGLNDSSNISTAKFRADKEYYAMPDYRGIPLQGLGGLTNDNAFIDFNGIQHFGPTIQGTPTNKLLLGTNLKLEWDSIFINTFVDIVIYTEPDYYNPSTGSTYRTERLLVMKKYFEKNDDVPNGAYVIEFHKSMNYDTTIIGTSLYFIDIISRRTLLQISQDLQELNNIQRSRFKEKDINNDSLSFYNYERDMNYKIPTDSYAKILLSDVDTIKELTSLIYTDYKNELAMNVTRLDKEYNINILNTDSFNGKLLVICGEKHDLKNDDGVVLEFNGGTYSSAVLNQQYFGYNSVKVVDEYKFYIDLPYVGNVIGNDTGLVKYTRKDPFFNYQPIDIIDIGVDKKGKIAIELDIDNLVLTDDKYSLVNVDFNKYRFRLVDGLNIEILSTKFPWVLEAEVSGAVLGMDTDLVWYKGTWECGRWFGGTWNSGTWKSGDWYDGTWNSRKITDNLISVSVDSNTSDNTQSTWFGGRWYNGTWDNGTWVDGRWYNGTWNNGRWYNGIWNDGIWNNGEFSGGVWVTGTWNNGILNCNNNPSYWIDGKWSGGDFENGIWYNGIFEERNSPSRFGTKAYNSRTANWRAGKWLSGSFYSRTITDNNNNPIVSNTHKYSIWKTGTWYSGDWYGGIAYNIDLQSSTWYGGILEEIQVVGINNNKNFILLNGEFNFNSGDDVNIINMGSTYSTQNVMSSTRYKVVKSEIVVGNNITKLYIDINNSELISTNDDIIETNLRLVSRVRSTNWKSGIWTNGLYESGLWEGGIWYNGIFNAKWM